MIEEYIEGIEFTVDGIKCGDKHITLAISEKKHYPHNTNIAYQLFFSNTNDHFDYDLLKQTNNTFVDTSNLPDGCLTHAEYKYSNGRFYLIEIGARGGGALVASHIVPIMSGVDNYKYMINTSLNIKQKAITLNDRLENRCSVLYFFHTPGEGGIVKDIKGLKFIKSCKNIITYKLNFKVSDKIEAPDNDAARIGFYIAYGESKEELMKLMDKINDKFQILYN